MTSNQPFWLLVIFLPVYRYYGVVVGSTTVAGTVVFGNGKMNWLPLGINIVSTPGASFNMYWYCSNSGLFSSDAAISSLDLASASAWINRASAAPFEAITAASA